MMTYLNTTSCVVILARGAHEAICGLGNTSMSTAIYSAAITSVKCHCVLGVPVNTCKGDISYPLIREKGDCFHTFDDIDLAVVWPVITYSPTAEIISSCYNVRPVNALY